MRNFAIIELRKKINIQSSEEREADLREKQKVQYEKLCSVQVGELAKVCILLFLGIMGIIYYRHSSYYHRFSHSQRVNHLIIISCTFLSLKTICFKFDINHKLFASLFNIDGKTNVLVSPFQSVKMDTTGFARFSQIWTFELESWKENQLKCNI